jgi:hypothetical protein
MLSSVKIGDAGGSVSVAGAKTNVYMLSDSHISDGGLPAASKIIGLLCATVSPLSLYVASLVVVLFR